MHSTLDSFVVLLNRMRYFITRKKGCLDTRVVVSAVRVGGFRFFSQICKGKASYNRSEMGMSFCWPLQWREIHSTKLHFISLQEKRITSNEDKIYHYTFFDFMC